MHLRDLKTNLENGLFLIIPLVLITITIRIYFQLWCENFLPTAVCCITVMHTSEQAHSKFFPVYIGTQ